MRIPEPRLPDAKEGLRYLTDLVYQIKTLFSTVGSQLNNLTEGRISAVTNASTAPPTTGDNQKGDFVRNSNVTELSSNGDNYVLLGWICTVAGNPGTWEDVRTLTTGDVGGYSSNTTTGTALTSSVPANATSVALAAGTWDIQATCQFTPDASVDFVTLQVGVSTTSATLGALGTKILLITDFTPASPQTISSPTVRVTLASPTTVYCVCYAEFAAGTVTVDGFIRATRVKS